MKEGKDLEGQEMKKTGVHARTDHDMGKEKLHLTEDDQRVTQIKRRYARGRHRKKGREEWKEREV